jgi:hypothetical protein
MANKLPAEHQLYVEAWHWNSRAHGVSPIKGYFVGDATPTEFIRHSFGYPLPHAGFSQPDGRGYSRLTDGDVSTYWKSNPYLTKAYTSEDDTLHPQWVVVDLASLQEVNAIQIDWADPYAAHLSGPVLDWLNPLPKPLRDLGYVSRRCIRTAKAGK